MLLPFTTDVDGITTAPFGQPVKFEFLQQFEETDIKMLQDNLISQSICLIKSKEKHVKFLQDEIHFQRIERQLKCEILQQKIEKFQSQLNQEVCSSLPNAFWKRKASSDKSSNALMGVFKHHHFLFENWPWNLIMKSQEVFL